MALYIIGTALLPIILYVLSHDRIRQNTKAALILAAIYIALAVIGGVILNRQLLPAQTDTHGWLVPANDPTPPLPPRCKAPNDALIVFLGSETAWTTNKDERILTLNRH